MNIKTILPIAFLIIIILNCSSQNDYIIPVDFKEHEKEFVHGLNGLTQEEVNEIDRRFFKKIHKNSIGKELPHTLVKDMNDKEIDLRTLVNKKTVIGFADAYCGWGIESLTNDLNKGLKKLAEENPVDWNVICLLVKIDLDYEDPELFNDGLDRLKDIYPNLYIIDEKDSKRLNIFGFPTRLYINSDKVLTHIGNGASITGRLDKELKKHLLTESNDSTL